MTAASFEPTTSQCVNEHSTIKPNLPNTWIVLWVLICTLHLTKYYYHGKFEFQSESTLHFLLEYEPTPRRKQAPYLKFKWQQRGPNLPGHSTYLHTQSFCQTRQMNELCCEYLSVQCIWLHVITMSRTSLGTNRQITVCLNVMELLAQSSCDIWTLNDSSMIQTDNQLVRKQTLNHLAKLSN